MRDIIKDPWIQGYSGKIISLLNPTEDDIMLADIAHGLANTCRFGGACVQYYSVAQHSVIVSRLVPHELALWGLMHDASEAYLGDVPRPLKLYLNGKYATLEGKFMHAICKRFGMSYMEPGEVMVADRIALVTERRDLIVEQSEDWGFQQKPLPYKIVPLGPQQAKEEFIREYMNISTRGAA